MITKNFRLNSLANQFSAAIYNHITANNADDHFMIDTGDEPVRVNIIGGVQGVRNLVDGYVLEALKSHYPEKKWEYIGIAYLSRCITAGKLTKAGHIAWESMVADMGATVGGAHGR